MTAGTRAPPWIVRIVRLTRREYFADFFITPPITAILAGLSLARGPKLAWPALFLFGWLAWTFYEYVVHRWVSHGLPIVRELHGLHHRDQRDYIALHPLATCAFYAGFWLAFGFASSALMVGFSTGYIVYAVLHTAFHHLRIRPGDFLHPGFRRHVAHHREGDVCYGVTCGWWDRLFGTERKLPQYRCPSGR